MTSGPRLICAQIESISPNGIAAEDFVVDNAQDDTAPTNSPRHDKVKFSAESAYVTQLKASEDLRFVSQPSGLPRLDNFPNYVYKKATKPSYIYSLGLGLAPLSLDFQLRDFEWVYTPRARYVGKDTRRDDSPSWHGTAFASKAAGNIYGVAKAGHDRRCEDAGLFLFIDFGGV